MSNLKLTTVIIAGGKSSRMGSDKSFVPLLGKPLIEHVLSSIDGIGDEAIIITNRPDSYAHLGLPIYQDVYPDHGPLGGLHAALFYSTHPHIMVVACDMPWLNKSLLEYMVSLATTADAIVPRWQRFPEPLHAIYNKSCLRPIEAKLKTKSLKLISFYSDVTVRFVEAAEIARYDPAGRSFANINTPEDLIKVGKQQ